MKELIAGRILKNLTDEEGKETGEQKSLAEIMADAIFDGMQGTRVLRSDEKGTTYANPLHVKAKDLALRARELKKEQKGTGGGIRIVLAFGPGGPSAETRPETEGPEVARSGSVEAATRSHWHSDRDPRDDIANSATDSHRIPLLFDDLISP